MSDENKLQISSKLSCEGYTYTTVKHNYHAAKDNYCNTNTMEERNKTT